MAEQVTKTYTITHQDRTLVMERAIDAERYVGERVYARGGSQYYDAEQFDRLLAKIVGEGARVVEG